MRVLVQRVTEGSVRVDNRVVGQIGTGLVLLVGISPEDSDADIQKMAKKVAHLRIFNDDAGKFDRSLLDIEGQALVVSQFTLYGDTKKGRRPNFTGAARPEQAEPMIDSFAQALREIGIKKVETGSFGANMDVLILNQGPVTIWLDSAV